MASRTPPPAQDWISLGWTVSYPLLAVVAAMIFLSAEEIARPAVRPARAPAIVDSASWSSDFAARVEALHQAVLAAPLAASVAGEDRQGAGTVRWTHRTLVVTLDRQSKGELEAAIDGLRAADAGVTLVSESTFNGSQVLIGLDGLLTHTLRVYWADQPQRPRIGVVVAALGDDLRLARQFIELDAPVTVAVLPFRPFSAQVAELAKIFKREVLLDWNGGEGAERGVEAALGTVPGAVGVAVRRHDDGADALMALLRERGLIAIRTEGDAGAGPRVVLLPMDGDGGPAAEIVATEARSGGSAVGIAVVAGGDELRRLRSLLERWTREEFDVVDVSQLFRPVPAT